MNPAPGKTDGFRYLLFHKPYQVLCQFTGDGSKRNLSHYIPIPHVYPVGRLDFDSEGLLLLTDDGPLQHRFAHPRFAHTRTYLVQVEGTATAAALDRLSAGLALRDYVTKPCRVSVIDPPTLAPRTPPVRFRQAIPTSWLELTLTEGRNRQVRHMTAAIGLPTLRLVRIAIGPLILGTLAPGEWRELSHAEIVSAQNSAAPS